MDAAKGTVIGPAAHVIVHRAAWWQVLGQGGPLAAIREDIHDAVDDITLDNSSLVAALFRNRDQWADQRPFVIRQVAGVA